MIRNTVLVALLGLGGFSSDLFLRSSSAQAFAQAPAITPAPASDPLAVKRGFNLARGTAIRLNGGLNQYRPARCMFDSSINNRCLAQRMPQAWFFTSLVVLLAGKNQALLPPSSPSSRWHQMDEPLRNRFTTALQEMASPADRHGLILIVLSIESTDFETKNNINHHLKFT